MATERNPQRTVVIKHDGLRSVGAFAAFPTKIIRNAAVSLGGRLTYGLLLSYAWQEDFCFPAQEQLAKDLGVTDRQVRRFLMELREKGLVDWKQQGLNRPNIYYILEIEPTKSGPPEETPEKHNKSTDRTSVSGPDRTDTSAQERTQVSDYKESSTKTHMVVNDVTPNDREQSGQKPRKPGRGTPRISDRALRATYTLTDEQIGRVHWLVDKQAKTLGHVERNHGAYVKRAAEAVRDGLGDRLDFKLGDFTQAASEIAVGSRPAYFHAMWTEEAASHAPVRPTSSGNARPRTTGLERLDFQGRLDRMPADLRGRLIEYAAAQGHRVPAGLANASAEEIARWYDGLPTGETQAG